MLLEVGLGQRFGPQKIRHTTATMMLRNRANLETVRRTLGHAEISTTEIYLYLTDRDVAEAHKQFSHLPYHWLGEIKYERLEANYYVSNKPRSEKTLKELRSVIERFGLPNYIGR
jgi:hypothetical protein